MHLKEIKKILEAWAPPALQESYDNSGLLVGDPDWFIKKALICLDITDDVIEEALEEHCNLIIAHHPVIFTGLKRLTGKNMTERLVIKAIKNDIALYAIHTNLDNIDKGVNARICERLGIMNAKILDPKKGMLKKLVTFCPDMETPDGRPISEMVLESLWEAGAGHIGNYDQCSFSASGIGSFRPGTGTQPFIGAENELEKQAEIRIEVIFPSYAENAIVKNLIKAHPYEEVAYDIFSLENNWNNTGAGIIGELDTAMDEEEFLLFTKAQMETSCIRHSPFIHKKIKKVAVCGGSGSFLLQNAIGAGADVLVTGDFKYHQFFDADRKILIADIGHYESEQFTIGLIFDKIKEKLPNFALLKTRVNTNPVNYI